MIKRTYPKWSLIVIDIKSSLEYNLQLYYSRSNFTSSGSFVWSSNNRPLNHWIKESTKLQIFTKTCHYFLSLRKKNRAIWIISSQTTMSAHAKLWTLLASACIPRRDEYEIIDTRLITSATLSEQSRIAQCAMSAWKWHYLRRAFQIHSRRARIVAAILASCIARAVIATTLVKYCHVIRVHTRTSLIDQLFRAGASWFSFHIGRVSLLSQLCRDRVIGIRKDGRGRGSPRRSREEYRVRRWCETIGTCWCWEAPA